MYGSVKLIIKNTGGYFSIYRFQIWEVKTGLTHRIGLQHQKQIWVSCKWRIHNISYFTANLLSACSIRMLISSGNLSVYFVLYIPMLGFDCEIFLVISCVLALGAHWGIILGNCGIFKRVTLLKASQWVEEGAGIIGQSLPSFRLCFLLPLILWCDWASLWSISTSKLFHPPPCFLACDG